MDTLTTTRATTDPRVLTAATTWLQSRDHNPDATVTAVDLLTVTGPDDVACGAFAVTLQLADGAWRDVQGGELLDLLPRLFAAQV